MITSAKTSAEMITSAKMITNAKMIEEISPNFHLFQLLLLNATNENVVSFLLINYNVTFVLAKN